MEFAKGYNSYVNYLNILEETYKDNKEILNEYYANSLLMIMYLVIKLADIGFIHGDYHCGNIMFDELDETFINGKKGRPLFIDFGLSKKLSINESNIVKSLIKKQQYTSLLFYISNIHKEHGFNLASYPKTYGYISGSYNLLENKAAINFNYPPFYNRHNVNKRIIDTIKNRDIQIDKNISHMANQGIYLPLSSTYINKLFRGIFQNNTYNTTNTNKSTKTNTKTNTKVKSKVYNKPVSKFFNKLTNKIKKPFAFFSKLRKNLKTKKNYKNAMQEFATANKLYPLKA